ncbi:MAG TPA: hypothetical protein VHK70_07650 [Burkholderiaceae bacterium]|nr:hypothetical protein [Burkholderiaceae bacterium]
MPDSKKQDRSRRVPPKSRSGQASPSLSSTLPSSPGDSPLHVTPKDITPDDASWKDLVEREIRPRIAGQMLTHELPEMDEQVFQAQRAVTVNQLDAERTASPGDSSIAVTPKDITPRDASWHDLAERKIASEDAEQREESILDEAIELSFPASDPPVERPVSARTRGAAACEDDEELLLDEAIELTFPASDPIALSPPDMTYRTVEVRSP